MFYSTTAHTIGTAVLVVAVQVYLWSGTAVLQSDTSTTSTSSSQEQDYNRIVLYWYMYLLVLLVAVLIAQFLMILQIVEAFHLLVSVTDASCEPADSCLWCSRRHPTPCSAVGSGAAWRPSGAGFAHAGGPVGRLRNTRVLYRSPAGRHRRTCASDARLSPGTPMRPVLVYGTALAAVAGLVGHARAQTCVVSDELVRAVAT